MGDITINKMDTIPSSHYLMGKPLNYYVIQVESAGRRKYKLVRECVAGIPDSRESGEVSLGTYGDFLRIMLLNV